MPSPPSCTPVTGSGPASPGSGRSKPGTTRRSTPTSASTCFYVDNWSLSLDLVVLLGTAEQLVMRPFASRRQGELTGGVVAADTPAFATAA